MTVPPEGPPPLEHRPTREEVLAALQQVDALLARYQRDVTALRDAFVPPSVFREAADLETRG